MSLWRHLIGLTTTLLFLVITLLAMIPLLPLAMVKWLFPEGAWQQSINRRLDWIASRWMDMNSAHQKLLTGTDIQQCGDVNLRCDQWYMMIANHQSWVDILVILRIFNGRIPYVKFFLKKSLIWVPLLGIAWWALDFPFMRRHSKAELERNPALKGRDIEETRRACEKYQHNPVTIINFLEGTRFTPQKHNDQSSPYRQLLVPKAGGMAFTLSAMNGQLQQLLDVTIYYPDGIPTYWDYACGKVKRIRVHISERAMPEELLGDYGGDERFRVGFQQWVNQLWQEKDARLLMMKQESASH